MQIEVLGERYQLQDPIGQGGMATIHRGRDIHMDRNEPTPPRQFNLNIPQALEEIILSLSRKDAK